MATLAFLTARRWPDLAPPDRRAAAVLERSGVRVEPVVWDDAVDWARFDALVLRSTWDYPEKVDAFRSWLVAIEASCVRLINPVPTVRWNLDKRYLAELQRCDVPIVPTHFPEPGERLGEILASRNWSRAVVKPRISADGYRTFLTDRSLAAEAEAGFAALLESSNGVMVQAFLPQVQESGEYSFVFFAGAFSHAVLKRPAPGDFRVQERFGGTLHIFEPPAGLVGRIETLLQAVPVPWTYARVDACPAPEGVLVMEVELIEPSLLFEHASDAGVQRFADAVILAAGV